MSSEFSLRLPLTFEPQNDPRGEAVACAGVETFPENPTTATTALLAPDEEIAANPGDQTAADHQRTLIEYLLGMQRSKQPLPAHPDQPGLPWFAVIADDLGIPPDVLTSPSSSLHDVVLRWAKTIGTAARERPTEIGKKFRPRVNTSHTIADLNNLAQARIRDDCEQNNSPHADACSTMRKTLKAVSALTRTSPKKTDAKQALDAALDLAANPLSEMACHHAMLRRARSILDDARKGKGTPNTFHGFLKYECALRGTIPSALATVSCIDKNLLAKYANNSKVPGEAKRTAIAKIELFFGVPEDSLWGLIKRKAKRRGHIFSEDLPDDMRSTRYKGELVRRHLKPTFSQLSREEQEIELDRARKEIAEAETRPTGLLAKQRQDRYALKEFPPLLQAEIESFKNALAPAVLALGTVSKKKGCNEQTLNIWVQRISQFLGFLVNRLNELENVPEYRGKGPFTCVAAEDLTLGLLLIPDLLAAFCRWLVWRKTTFGRAANLTPTDLEFLTLIERMTRSISTKALKFK